MPLKVRFTLRAEPSLTDSRTTVSNLISMQFMDDDSTYLFPENYKALSNHDALMALPTAATAKRDLTPRWTKRSFKITLSDELAALYVDVEGNACFGGRLLDEADDAASSVRSMSASRSNTELQTPPATAPRSLSSVLKDAVIPKFGSKSAVSNANAWIEIFE